LRELVMSSLLNSARVTVPALAVLLACLASIRFGVVQPASFSAGSTGVQDDRSDLPMDFDRWPAIRARSLDDATIRIFTKWQSERLAYRFVVDRYPRAIRAALGSATKGGVVITFQNEEGAHEVRITVPTANLRHQNGGWFSKGTLEANGDIVLQESQYARLHSWRMAWMLPGRAPIMLGYPEAVRRPAEGERPPVPVLNVSPVYPEAARVAGVRGVVIVSFTIGADGTVTDAWVERSIPLLDQAALDAVKQWRFEPALSAGVPVQTTRVTTFAFP
jgi:TonB family protein